MERPTAVLVLGICNIVVGLGGGCCGGFAALGAATILSEGGWEAPLLLLLGVLIVLCSLGLVVSGAGLLGYFEWARKLALISSFVYLPVAALDLALGLVTNLGGHLDQASGAEAAGLLVGGAIGVLCGGAIRLAYPSVLLYFLTRPHIKAAFR